MSASSAPPWLSRVGPYRIERRLGAGGMGVVYLGRDHQAGTLAAIKLIRPEYAANEQLRARLRHEVTAASRVPRFCTAPVLAFDVDADTPWVATEYIDAPTLDAALIEHGPLAGPALERFAVGVAVALRAIHEHGVVHRDLKPSNILLTTLGPRVIDFGIARVEGVETRLTRTGTVVGTPAYMAPEQLRGEPVTAAVDVFAWAGLVAFAASGRPPFGGGEAAMYAILRDEPDLGGLAGPLRELVLAALDKLPATRPSSAELVARLAAVLPAAATRVLADATTRPPVPPVSSYRRSRRRRAMLTTALGAVVAVALAATAVAVARDPDGGEAAGASLSRRLAAESLVLGTTDPQLSMQRALDAWAAGRTTEARSALLSAYSLPFAGRLGTGPGGVSVAVDPAGTMVAVGHADGTVRLWEAATRQPIGEPLAGHTAAVYRMAFSPDGAMLATASAETNEDGLAEGVRVWEVPAGRLVRSLPAVAAVAWLPGGETLVATRLEASAEGVVASLGVWDPVTGEELTSIQTDRMVADLAVSRDGRLVAGGHDDGTAGVWRLADGSPVTEISGHEEQLVRVAFAATGELATVGLEGRIELWQPPDAPQPRSITEPGDRTSGRMVFTPDGHLLAAGGGSAIQWFDLASGELRGEYVGFGGTPFDVATSADGRLVAATGTDAPTVLWRRATYWLPHPDTVMGVAFAPRGGRLAIMGEQGTVRLWNPDTGGLASVGAHDGQGYGVAYAGDGTLASTAADGTVRLIAPDGEPRGVLPVADGYEAAELAFSPDGSLLAVAASPPLLASGQNVIYVWDTRTMRPRRVLELGEAKAYGLAFTGDGVRLLAATHVSQAALGNGEARTELHSWQTRGLAPQPPVALGPDQVVDLAVSPDGGTLATAGERRTIELRDGAGGGPVREIGVHPATVRQVVFSPDGTMLATITTDEGTIRLWDLESGELVAALTGHAQPLNAIAFSPDGRTLTSGGLDRFVGLWAMDPADAIGRLCQAIDHSLCTQPPPTD